MGVCADLNYSFYIVSDEHPLWKIGKVGYKDSYKMAC